MLYLRSGLNSASLSDLSLVVVVVVVDDLGRRFSDEKGRAIFAIIVYVF